MASPGELVQLMADILGTSKASVVQYDRTLSEHGLRSRGGRGTSAARVNSLVSRQTTQQSKLVCLLTLGSLVSRAA